MKKTINDVKQMKAELNDFINNLDDVGAIGYIHTFILQGVARWIGEEVRTTPQKEIDFDANSTMQALKGCYGISADTEQGQAIRDIINGLGLSMTNDNIQLAMFSMLYGEQYTKGK